MPFIHFHAIKMRNSTQDFTPSSVSRKSEFTQWKLYETQKQKINLQNRKLKR